MSIPHAYPQVVISLFVKRLLSINVLLPDVNCLTGFRVKARVFLVLRVGLETFNKGDKPIGWERGRRQRISG